VPLVISADGKGVAMRPGARRKRTRAEHKRVRTFAHRRGTGENKGKRMAETGAVFDIQIPDGPPRTPEQVMRPDPDPRARPPGPRAVNRWYTCDITADRADTISKVFDHAERRDPGRQRTWVALADGDRHQLSLIQHEAASRGIPVTILIDLCRERNYADARGRRGREAVRGRAS
jgi:hypothetical protein